MSDITIRFLGDIRKLSGSIDAVNDRLGSVGSGFKRLAGAAAGAFAGFQIGSKLWDAVQAGSDLNETISKTGVIFGEATKGVTDFAADMAKKFGLNKQVMLDAAGNIGLVGKAAGFTQDEAAKLGTDFTKLAADASSFFNVPMEEALEKIRSGLVGESEPLRAFGVLLSEDAVKAEALALGISNGTEKLTEAQKVQARASLITKGLSDATGDLERTSGSFANRLRMLQGRAANFAAEMGGKLIPVFLKLFDFLEGPAARIGGQIFNSLSQGVGKLVNGISAIKFAWTEGVTSDGFIGVMERIGDTARRVFDAVKSFIIENRDTFVEWARKVQEIGAQVGQTLVTAWEFISTVFTTGVAIVRKIWDEWGDSIWSTVKRVVDVVVNVLSGGFEIVQGIFQTVSALLKGDWGQLWEGIKNILAGAWDVIKAVVSGAFRVLLIWFGELGGNILDRLAALPGQMWQMGVDIIWGLINGVASMAGRLASKVWDTVTSPVRAVKRWLGIGSPSKLLMGWGQDTAAGFAIGLSRGQSGVEGAMAGLRGAVEGGGTASARLAVTGGSRPVGAGAGVVVTINNPTIVGAGGIDELADLIRAALIRRSAYNAGVGLS